MAPHTLTNAGTATPEKAQGEGGNLALATTTTARTNNILPTAEAQADLESAVTFIAAVTGSRETRMCFRTFDDTKASRRDLTYVRHGTLAEHAAELTRLNDAGAGVFFVVNEGGDTDASITALRALFTDHDEGPFDTAKVPAEMAFPAFIVTTSPDKAHAYWPLQPGESVDRFREAQRRLIANFGSDPKIKNLSRVMRLPGFVHRKGAPCLVEWALNEEQGRYTIDQVVGCLPAPPPEPPTGVIDDDDHEPDEAVYGPLYSLARRVELATAHLVKIRDKQKSIGKLRKKELGIDPEKTTPGDDTFLIVARDIVRGFDIPIESAREVIDANYNMAPWCDPPWLNEREYAWKLSEARKPDPGRVNDQPWGWLIAKETNRVRSVTRTDSGAPEPTPEQIAALIPRGTRCTQLGNAERFAAAWRGKVRYCAAQRRWYTWCDTHWKKDEAHRVQAMGKLVVRAIYHEASTIGGEDEDRTKLRQAVAKHARDSEKASEINAMLALAQSEPGIATVIDDFDRDPWLLNCPNGTLDLRTGELRPHNPDDLITRITAAPYDPAATSELWDRVLREATGGDAKMIDYLSRVAGYALAGVATEKAFFFLHGPTDTAKSTVVNAIAHALGSYHVATDFDTWLVHYNVGGNRGDLVRLVGTRLVTAVEVQPGARFDARTIKNVTGGDKIVAAAKYEGEIEFTPTFTLLFAANDAPRINTEDGAMWGRAKIIPFEHTVANPDETVRTRLQSEECAAAVLAWAVRGCAAWQKRGLRVAPDTITEAGKKLRDEMDPTNDFFEEMCAFVAEKKTTNGVLWNNYSQWCKTHGAKQISAKVMAAKLRARGCEPGGSNGSRLWKGVGIQPQGQ